MCEFLKELCWLALCYQATVAALGRHKLVVRSSVAWWFGQTSRSNALHLADRSQCLHLVCACQCGFWSLGIRRENRSTSPCACLLLVYIYAYVLACSIPYLFTGLCAVLPEPSRYAQILPDQVGSRGCSLSVLLQALFTQTFKGICGLPFRVLADTQQEPVREPVFFRKPWPKSQVLGWVLGFS